MSQDFDAYYKWLGIPPAHQPPDHYRLLGIQPFEADADVIEAAADGRLAHLRSYQSGKHQAICQKLLNEVSNARVCLLHPQQRAAYDTQLRASQAPPVAKPASNNPRNAEPAMPAMPTAPPPTAPVLPPVQMEDVFATAPTVAAPLQRPPQLVHRRPRKKTMLPMILAITAGGLSLVVVAVLLLGGLLLASLGSTETIPEADGVAAIPTTPDKPLADTPAGKVVDLIAISAPEVHGEKGRWHKVGDALVVSNPHDQSFFSPPYNPPDEYDLEVSFSRLAEGPTPASDTHIRMQRGSECYIFGVRALKSGGTALSFWGDGEFGSAPLGVKLSQGFKTNERHTLKFALRESGINVFLDREPLFTIDDYSMLRTSSESTGLGSYQNSTKFHTFIVRELSSNQSAPAEPEQPRAISLFNGKDLTGWKFMTIAYSRSGINNAWKADLQGNLICKGGDFNELGTYKTYRDFKLSLQWRFGAGPVFPNGSGIIVRSRGMDDKNHNPRGIEIDLRPNENPDKFVGTGCLIAYGITARNHTGAANGQDQRRLGWLRRPFLKRDGEWNDCTITCQGGNLVVEMNGEVVNRAWDVEMPEGSIVLRNQKAAVEFRNLEILELNP